MTTDQESAIPASPGPPRLGQFAGCLLGQAVGDALGAPFEGLPDGVIYEMGPLDALLRDPGTDVLRYTDDTQMAIGVAETLAEHGRIDEGALGRAFGANFEPSRGYGTGARRILEAIRRGEDAGDLARTIFPGGSLGNGAAMRAAPIGLMFADDLDRAAEEAERSSRPTHTHPIGIDGARLIAVAAALASRPGRFDRRAFYRELAPYAKTEEFRWQLSVAAQLKRSDAVGGFGNGLEAHRSVTTAIAIFAGSPDDYPAMICRAIGQGNDTDTLAAMAGALGGARLGVEAVPPHLIARLEAGRQGRSYLEALAARLHQAHLRRIGRPGGEIEGPAR